MKWSAEDIPSQEGRIALVTGANIGLGLETVRALASKGATVLMACRSRPKAEDARALLLREGLTKLEIVDLDLADLRSVSAAASTVKERYGQLDLLINNAGVSGSHPDVLNTDTWDEQMNVNARGVFLGMRAVIPKMKEAGSGSIVNISSISGLTGQKFVHMGYNAAKGAVRLATKAASVQFARDNIRVNSVHPGLMPAMRTSMMSADPEVRRKMINAVPMGREGHVEEVAHANLFLASDDASYITGIEVPVDGGFVAQ